MRVLPITALVFAIACTACTGRDASPDATSPATSTVAPAATVAPPVANPQATAVSVPAAAATAPQGQPFLNEVKLLSICCSDHVVLQIPVLQFDESGRSTKRIWEIHIAGGKFQSAAYRPPSVLDSADES